MLLRDATAAAVYPLTQMLDTKRMQVSPTPGSMVELLVTTGGEFQLCQQNVGKPGWTITPPEAAPLCNTYAGLGEDAVGANDLDIALEESVKLLVESMSGYIDFARNVVAPECASLAESVIGALNSLDNSQLGKMDLLIKDVPAILTNGALLVQLADYEGKVSLAPKMCFTYTPRAASDLVELMRQGNGMDKEIIAWANTKDASFFPKVWDTFFTAIGHSKDFIAELASEDYDVALAVYLMAGNLIDEPTEPQSMALITYHGTMAGFRDQAGKYLFNKLKLVDLSNKSKTLVIGGTDTLVVVNGQVYSEYVDAGGTPEILFGNLVTGNKLRALSDLINSGETLTKAWTQHSAYVQVAERNHRTTKIRKYFCEFFSASQKGTAVAVAGEYKQFETLIERMPDNDLNNIYLTALSLLCSTRYAHTNAYAILRGIDDICKDNPELDVREAATLANLEYLVDWICNENLTVKAF